MDILIVAHFCGGFSKENNGRFTYIASLLTDSNDVEIVTSDFDHGTKKPKMSEDETRCKITYLHESPYGKNVNIKRLWSHFGWGWRLKKYLQERKKPDVIYCAVPSLTGPFWVAKYCSKNDVRFVIDVQDLWPEAFQMVLHVPVLSSIIFAPFKHVANYIYRSADSICAVSETYAQRALQVNRKCIRGHIVFLGTDLNMFDRNAKENQDKAFALVKRTKQRQWLAYCGTLGSSYDLTCVMEALEEVGKRGYTAPVFIVMGDGPRRGEFEASAKEHGVDAVFTGLLPYNQMCAILCQCDITVNPITHGAAQSIINKHADYAASGLPVISTQESEEYRKLVDEYRMGFNCRVGDAADMVDKILQLMQDDDMRERVGKNARRCAEERFDREKTYQELVDAIINAAEG